MTEQEVSVGLTENDERLYACAKRLEAVERRQDALDKLVTAVEVLAVRQESVEGNVKEIRNAVQSITEKPGKLDRVDDVVHHLRRLADRKTADGVAIAVNLCNLLHVPDAQIFKGRTLIDAEKHLPRVDGIRQGV